MKKIQLFFAVIVLLHTAVQAQDISTDTMLCGVRQPNYFYGHWYDTADWYLFPDTHRVGANDFSLVRCEDPMGHFADVIQQYAPYPIRITGLWAMLSQYLTGMPQNPSEYWAPVADTTRLPEYLYLYVRDSNPRPCGELGCSYFLTRIATARWDTAQPKMMCFRTTADGRYPNAYCHVYEAYFDTVLTIQGEFWIGASTYNNSYNNIHQNGPIGYQHRPSNYVCFWAYNYRGDSLRFNPYAHYTVTTSFDSSTADGPWITRLRECAFYGPYGAIIDGQQRYMETASADSAQGMAGYSAYYPDSTYQTITAMPMKCYTFSHWNDGVTDNPRTVYVTSDTMFTAYFKPAKICGVMVRSSDTDMGSATRLLRRRVQPGDLLPPGSDPYYITVPGDSTYCERDEVIFRAKANEGYVFCRWSNGSSDNPLIITVHSDTMLTAYFAPEGMHMVSAQSNNNNAGHVTGAGNYPSCDTAWLTAVVDDSNYLFRHWSNGSTENPLAVVYTGDTMLTAYFTTLEMYHVEAQCNDDAMGHVVGTGTYYEGDEAVLTAVPTDERYLFDHWSTGSTANPLRVVVLSDMVVTAYFVPNPDYEGIDGTEEPQRVFTLSPNPARRQVEVRLSREAEAGTVLRLRDAAGHEVVGREVAAGTKSLTVDLAALPKGAYFVTLATPEGSATQKLVVE